MRLADCYQAEGSTVLHSNPHLGKVAFSSEVHIAHLVTGGDGPASSSLIQQS